MDRRDVHENPSANQVILVNISHLKGKVARMVLLVQDRAKVNGFAEKEGIVD
jgi:hypothetical protein